LRGGELLFIPFDQSGDHVTGDVAGAVGTELFADVEISAAEIDDRWWSGLRGQEVSYGIDVGRYDCFDTAAATGREIVLRVGFPSFFLIQGGKDLFYGQGLVFGIAALG